MLGEIKKVPLRKVWNKESYDFTPWLSENLTRLGDALGLELEFEAKEATVGPYSADILAKDTGTDKFVVIENQLEKTNHDHLGKCITYASVLDASAVIWIASNFTEEHKKALDWLNDHTSDNIAFYGVLIELWQIDNSQPAVRFNVVCSPNEIVRQATQRKELGELTETKQRQLDFWTSFRERLARTKKVRSLQTPRPQYWFDVAIGKSGIHLSNTFNTDKDEIGVRVYISNLKADEWLPYFESKKDEIESAIGNELNWNPNPSNRDKVIVLTKTFDFSSTKGKDDALNWLLEKTLLFKLAFGNAIKMKD